MQRTMGPFLLFQGNLEALKNRGIGSVRHGLLHIGYFTQKRSLSGTGEGGNRLRSHQERMVGGENGLADLFENF